MLLYVLARYDIVPEILARGSNCPIFPQNCNYSIQLVLIAKQTFIDDWRWYRCALLILMKMHWPNSMECFSLKRYDKNWTKFIANLEYPQSGYSTLQFDLHCTSKKMTMIVIVTQQLTFYFYLLFQFDKFFVLFQNDLVFICSQCIFYIRIKCIFVYDFLCVCFCGPG